MTQSDSHTFLNSSPTDQPIEALAQPFGLYIHIPFCQRKCPYCDFNTYAKLDTLFDAYVEALCAEIAHWGEKLARRQVHTIFLGGGTPTVLEEGALARIFNTVHNAFDLAADCEITSEANPGTVDQAKFQALHRLGVNRLSMGVQSFQPDELQFLGRIHSVDDVHRAYATARDAGFANINLDFIFGLPHQPVQNWQKTLDTALALAPEHLSLYSLIVEPNTPLHHWVASGNVDAPDDDEAGLLYEIAMQRLADAGYVHYEVSNWAVRSPQTTQPVTCGHNLIYWRNQEYLGVGPGAHSYLRTPEAPFGIRWSNRKPVPGYIKRITAGDPVEDFQEVLDAPTSMGETMMLGLRLIREGVSFEQFYQRYNRHMTDVYRAEIERFVDMGMLLIDADRLRLSPRGLMVANSVVAAFLP